ncbi:hypothetical protein GQ57_04960 [Burkholderia sp. MSh2]|uniref:hypothetical protein n=1 Tax=Burkholderia TaxID=32008 RepID=UPI0004D4E253|nr:MULTISPECIES: hypothetical protein [Burkholderia]KEZ06755.1 hypothetical protein GQ57_04960 [Burkholderia sp. MSh2]
MKENAPREQFLIACLVAGTALVALTSTIFAICEPAFLSDYLGGSAMCLAACFLARKFIQSTRGRFIDISRYTTSASMGAVGLAVIMSAAGILLKLASGTPVFLFVVPATLGAVIHDIGSLRRYP